MVVDRTLGSSVDLAPTGGWHTNNGFVWLQGGGRTPKKRPLRIVRRHTRRTPITEHTGRRWKDDSRLHGRKHTLGLVWPHTHKSFTLLLNRKHTLTHKHSHTNALYMRDSHSHCAHTHKHKHTHTLSHTGPHTHTLTCHSTRAHTSTQGGRAQPLQSVLSSRGAGAHKGRHTRHSEDEPLVHTVVVGWWCWCHGIKSISLESATCKVTARDGAHLLQVGSLDLVVLLLVTSSWSGTSTTPNAGTPAVGTLL